MSTNRAIARPVAIALGMVAAVSICLGAAPAAIAGPASDSDAVIDDLWAQGYRVIITKIGAGHPSRCAVKSVTRQSPTTDVSPNRNMQNTLVVNFKVAHVTLLC